MCVTFAGRFLAGGRRRGAGAAVGLLAAAVWLATAGPAVGGAIFFAGEMNAEQKFTPTAAGYSVQYSTIELQLEDGRARATIEETLAGGDAQTRGVCLIPLPEAVIEKSVRLEASRNGAGTPDEFKALKPQFLATEAARPILQAVAKGAKSTAILSLSGRPFLLIPDLELGRRLKLRLSFTQKVDAPDGLAVVHCPMPAAAFSRTPVASVTLTATLKSKQPLRGAFSPTHECAIERKNLREAMVRLNASNLTGGGDFTFCFVAAKDALGLRVLTHRPVAEEEGFFLMLGNPTGDDDKAKEVEKDILFVLDTSGSMRGEKMEQARTAIEHCLNELNPGDRFNIVTFGTEVASFRGALTQANKKAVEQAKVYIDELVPNGRTNISEALVRGLAGKAEKGRPRMMIFLTDGTPTAGERVADKIVEGLEKLNQAGTRIFVMGLGHDVNVHLLDKLAELSDGSSEYVAPDEEIDVKVAALYNRVSHPVLQDVVIDWGELKTASVFPEKLPALFRGSEVMIAGRYRDGGKHEVKLAGTLRGEKREYACTLEFPEKKAPEHDFIAPIWAARKIGYYLQQIRLHGEDKELIEEVVRLSRTFGVVTEYTVFMADAKYDTMSDAEVAEEAKSRMARANREQSGKWAFNQADNDSNLQQRMVVNEGANMFVDRRGEVQKVMNVRQIGGRAFYLRDGQWMDANVQPVEPGAPKPRTVKMFSDEYFDLVKDNADFSKAQELGGEMTINVGKEVIEVKK